MADVKIVRFEEVKKDIFNAIRRKSLLPVLGSGFSVGCPSQHGVVPSGNDSKKYMIDAIRKSDKYSDDDIAMLEKRSFSRIHEVYAKIIKKEERRIYLRDRFTNVVLEEEKDKFLSVDWLYIYTLNLDDGIEQTSEYKTVILPHHVVNDSIYDEDKCVIKLHGDARTMIKYDDAKAILSRSEYIESINSNQSLLSRIEHDMSFQNIIFIGCSLDDELDLQSVSLNASEKSITSRYFCTDVNHKPNGLELDDLQDYGITHVIVFDSFVSIYTSIYNLSKEAKKITVNDLDGYEILEYNKSQDMSFEKNKGYLFFGKNLIDEERKILVPYYFVCRNEVEELKKRIIDSSVQVVIGTGYSGKTYIMIGLVKFFVSKKTYVFSSKDRISKSALLLLLKERGNIIFFDSKSLSLLQVKMILDKREELKNNQVYVFIFADKSDNDLAGYIGLMKQKGEIDDINQILLSIDNRFSYSETNEINSLLPKCELGAFNKGSILSNILRISEDMKIASLYSKYKPALSSLKEIVALIALATKRMLPELEAVRLGVISELDKQIKMTRPMLEKVPTWPFEKSAANNSQTKYVVNAERWLEYSLQNYAYNDNTEMIGKAYEYLIYRVISVYGQPDYGYQSVSHYKEYILFDNINRLFFDGSRYGKQSINLIRMIYDKLNELLATEPHYMHQKAKCYLRCSYYEKNKSDKFEILQRAYRIINTAKDVFYKKFEDTENEKVLISYEHTRYTQAVVLCQICRCNNYENMNENIKALHIVHAAFSSKYNSYTYAIKDRFNYGNAIYALVENLLANNRGDLSDIDKEELQQLFRKFKDEIG